MVKCKWLAVLFLIFCGTISAQTPRTAWKSSETEYKKRLELFHSTQVINLPTAEMMQKGDMLFEISHRFFPPVNANDNSFFGLDGPVNMRLGLGYALSNNMIITLARSNVNGNVDLQIKRKMLELDNASMPAVIAVQAGSAWNSKIAGREKGDGQNFQYYGQLILNTLMAHKKLGIGLVPTFLYNSDIFSNENQTSTTLGTYLQYYVSSFMSVMAEWNPTINGYHNRYNAMSFGLELETGGHFFKIILTNSALLNPSQFGTGADLKFASGDWRLGFNITRALKFGRSR
jgi:hypothetical protein